MTDTKTAEPPIRVGIVGLAPGRSWSARTHAPALRALPGYELVAVANSSAQSSRAAAEALDIPRALSDARHLAADPEVDLVAVTVKVQLHREPVDAALDAHKMVYCEWPLGTDLADAEEMANRAREVGVRTAVGLQARSAPTIRYVRDLIRAGYVGDVLSTTLIGSMSTIGGTELAANTYLNERANGANGLTIPFGHTVDALCWVLGEFREVSATLATRHRDRVLTLTLATSSPGGPDLPPPSAAISASFTEPAAPVDPADRAALVAKMVADLRLFAGTLPFDEEHARVLVERIVDRSDAPAAAGNHWLLVGGDPDEPPTDLAEITAPTLVWHGSADPLFPLPHGQAFAERISNARLVVLEGVGHEYPPPSTWDVVVTELLAHTAQGAPVLP